MGRLAGVDLDAQVVARAEHVVLLDRSGEGELVRAGEVRPEQQAAGRLFLDGEGQVDLVEGTGHLVGVDLDLAEISDGSIIIPHDEKCQLIHELSQTRTVMSEVGSKDSGILISPAKWVRLMKAELEAGSWKVIAEGREAGNVGVFRPNGTAHTMLINRIIANVKPEDILWEAPQKNQQVWFIKLFGAEVNLGNIAPNDVIPLECLRLGLRGDTFFDFLPKSYADRLKQVNDDADQDTDDEQE